MIPPKMHNMHCKPPSGALCSRDSWPTCLTTLSPRGRAPRNAGSCLHAMGPDAKRGDALQQDAGEEGEERSRVVSEGAESLVSQPEGPCLVVSVPAKQLPPPEVGVSTCQPCGCLCFGFTIILHSNDGRSTSSQAGGSSIFYFVLSQCVLLLLFMHS